jgi:hypothetical protein
MQQALTMELDGETFNGNSRLYQDQSNTLTPDPRVVARFGSRLERLFNRHSKGWGSRDTIASIEWLLTPFARGEIRASAVRLPLHATLAGLTVRHGAKRESLEHHQLKAAALAWMQAEGAQDAHEERWCPVGKADAHSAAQAWVVECGNTPMRKLFDAVEQDGVRRFTLIPYQATTWQDGTPRRLIAAEFVWDDDVPSALQAQTDAANAEAMRKWSDASRSPLNATRFGRA